MADLLDLQRRFRDATLKRDPGLAAALIRSAGIPAKQRLQIHRNNTLVTLTDALGATFPVLRQLVGDDFFGFMVQRFIETSPPAPGPLFAYGSGLPGFIAGFPPAAKLVYLADVARLEWAVNCAYFAADADPMALDAVAAIPPERLAQATFRLHPSHRLVASFYPVDRIWRMHQPGASAETIALDDGAAWLLVARPRWDVEVMSLTQGAFNLVLALDMGQPLQVAIDAACSADPDFDLADAMGALLTAEVFSAVTLVTETPEP